jgi:hypothetical protein
MSCYLSETCTAIDCCIDVEQISRSVNVYINLDACNYRLTAGIEKVTNLTCINRTPVYSEYKNWFQRG